MSKVDFSNHFKFADFEKVASHLAKKNVNHFKFDEWTLMQKRYEDTVILPALKTFFRELVQSGKMRKLEFNQASKLKTIQIWSAICEPSTSPINLDCALVEMRNILDAFIFHYCTLDHVTADRDPNIYRKRYDALVSRMSEGDLDFHETGCLEVCAEKGLQVAFGINDWQLILYGAKGRDFMRIDNIESECISEVIVYLRTGNLLVQNKINIDCIDAQVNRYSMDNNSVAGNRRVTEAKLDMGIIDVPVGKGVASVVQQDNGLIGCKLEVGSGELAKGQLKVASVTSDICRLSLVEKETLVGLVSKKLGNSEARQVVDDYIALGDVVQLSIKPGKYYLYHHGDFDRFAQEFSSPDIELENLRPSFILSGKRLHLNNLAALAEAPKKLRPH